MTKPQTPPPVGFTAGERNYIRGELDLFFSTLPTVAAGRRAVSQRSRRSPKDCWIAG